MDFYALVDEIARRTSGTRGDPLTREDIEQVLNAYLSIEAEGGEPSGGGVPDRSAENDA